MMRPLQPWLLPQAGVLLHLLILLGSSGAARAAAEAASGRVVLVTGATGRSGRLLYAQLKADAGNFSEVRAFVTNRTAAREVLNCTRCDASEGVFLGDVTNYSTLVPAVQGCDTVAITVGASESAPEALRRAIEFGGVENTVVALASQLPPGAAAANLRVALVSSEGTTIAHPTAAEGGTILHWKLNAEAFLMASGVSFTIIKPCALVDGPAAARQLVAFHDDSRMLVDYEVPRADLVRVLAAALVSDDLQGLRFGFCSRRGEPTADARTLLESARYPWNSG